jgi:hypothetical protein
MRMDQLLAIKDEYSLTLCMIYQITRRHVSLDSNIDTRGNKNLKVHGFSNLDKFVSDSLCSLRAAVRGMSRNILH